MHELQTQTAVPQGLTMEMQERWPRSRALNLIRGQNKVFVMLFGLAFSSEDQRRQIKLRSNQLAPHKIHYALWSMDGLKSP